MEFNSVILLNSAGPLLLVLLLLSCSAIMSSSEVAIFSLSPVQRKDLENANDSQSKNVIRLLEHPTPEIATKTGGIKHIVHCAQLLNFMKLTQDGSNMLDVYSNN